jgi:hypothetical protein
MFGGIPRLFRLLHDLSTCGASHLAFTSAMVVFTSASEPSKIKFRFYQTEGLTLPSILTSFKHNT